MTSSNVVKPCSHLTVYLFIHRTYDFFLWREPEWLSHQVVPPFLPPPVPPPLLSSLLPLPPPVQVSARGGSSISGWILCVEWMFPCSTASTRGPHTPAERRITAAFPDNNLTKNTTSVSPPPRFYWSNMTACLRLIPVTVQFLWEAGASERPCKETKQWLVTHQPGCLKAGNQYVEVWWSECAPYFSVSAAGRTSVWHVRESLSLPPLVYPCF